MARVFLRASVLACLALAACAQQPGPSQRAGPPPILSAPTTTMGACDAAMAQFAIGRGFDAALEKEVRERSGARVVRPLRPGQMVTMEYSAQRLNLDLDIAGKVVKARCG
ncbi:MAG: I78 family peptidase inhibitor [Ramlibacter sp.]